MPEEDGVPDMVCVPDGVIEGDAVSEGVGVCVVVTGGDSEGEAPVESVAEGVLETDSVIDGVGVSVGDGVAVTARRRSFLSATNGDVDGVPEAVGVPDGDGVVDAVADAVAEAATQTLAGQNSPVAQSASLAHALLMPYLQSPESHTRLGEAQSA